MEAAKGNAFEKALAMLNNELACRGVNLKGDVLAFQVGLDVVGVVVEADGAVVGDPSDEDTALNGVQPGIGVNVGR